MNRDPTGDLPVSVRESLVKAWVHCGLLQEHFNAEQTPQNNFCRLAEDIRQPEKHTIVFKNSGSDSEESACNAGDLGLIPESGRAPEGENGYSLQYSCLESSMDRGA
ncbi:hypothetical protein MG293_001621 [Ovis ammon polii]|uniref:Uncharacterized protein n=1 Tax=Ovis ammon polii TaxID=230172 RepID=A0AAD4UNF4_OVIAM|nr:hypothetical protein MG293_001621 [Ovis ammon polii]